MPIVSDVAAYFRNQALFMTGRWVMAAGLLAAGLMTPTSALAWTVIGATGLLQGVIIWRKQSEKQWQLINDYRDEIAARVGVDPTRVTTDHLHTVAYGDPSQGIEGNYVLAQSLERSAARKLVGILSTVAAAFVAVGVFVLLREPIQQLLQPVFEGLSAMLPAAIAPKSLAFFSMMVVSGTGMALINNMLDQVIEYGFGLSRRTAQSLIQEIRRDMNMNKTITQEQVFGVFVAANPGLDRIIETQYGKPYYQLKPAQQSDALAQYGRSFQNPAITKHTIAELTTDLNNRQIEADELVFAVVNQESGVPRLNTPQPVGNKKSVARQLKEEVSMALKGEHMTPAEQERCAQRQQQLLANHAAPAEPAAPEQITPEQIANDNVPGFAERFAPRHASAPTSHAKRVSPKHSHASATHAEREQQRSTLDSSDITR